jgi:hypothetical protein
VGAEGADPLEALQRVLRWHLGVLGDQRRVGRGGDDQLVAEALRVGEDERVAALGLDPLGGQAGGPEVQRGRGADSRSSAYISPVM